MKITRKARVVKSKKQTEARDLQRFSASTIPNARDFEQELKDYWSVQPHLERALQAKRALKTEREAHNARMAAHKAEFEAHNARMAAYRADNVRICNDVLNQDRQLLISYQKFREDLLTCMLTHRHFNQIEFSTVLAWVDANIQVLAQHTSSALYKELVTLAQQLMYQKSDNKDSYDQFMTIFDQAYAKRFPESH